MATDTKNESAPTEASPVISGGDSGQRQLKLSYKQELRRLAKQAALLIVFLVVLAGLGVLIRDFSHRNAVFQIDGKRYDQGQVKQLAAYQMEKQRIPYKTAAKKVYDALCYQKAAQSAHISVSSEEEKRFLTGVSPADYKKYKTWFDIVAYNDAVAAKLPAQAYGGAAAGYSYVFWFGDAVQPAYSASDRSPKYGNQQAYRSDQQYAYQKANYYHDQLQNKKITPDTALQAVKQDPKLSPMGLKGTNYSTKFGQDPNQWQPRIIDAAGLKYIKTLSPGSLSPVKIGTIATTLGPNPTQYVDAYYYVILVQKTDQSNTTQQFNDQRAHLNAKYYGVK